MNCTQHRESFSAYVDGQLKQDELSAVEAHLKACISCYHELGELKAMVKSLQTLPKPMVPDLLPGIHRQLKPAAWRRPFFAPWSVSLPWHGLAVAAAAMLVFVVTRPRQAMMLSKAKPEEVSLLQPAAAMKPDSFAIASNTRAGVPLKEAFDLDEEQLQQDEPARLMGAAVELASAGSGGSSGYGSTNPWEEKKKRIDQLVDSGSFERRMAQTADSLSKLEQAFAPTAMFKKQGFVADKAQPNTAQLLQLSLQVGDVRQAAARVIEWAEAHEGFAVITTPNHLSVMLPGSAVGAFLQEFMDDVSALSPTEPIAAWVTISLDLIQ